jgi:hypothetical protein
MPDIPEYDNPHRLWMFLCNRRYDNCCSQLEDALLKVQRTGDDYILFETRWLPVLDDRSDNHWRIVRPDGPDFVLIDILQSDNENIQSVLFYIHVAFVENDNFHSLSLRVLQPEEIVYHYVDQKFPVDFPMFLVNGNSRTQIRVPRREHPYDNQHRQLQYEKKLNLYDSPDNRPGYALRLTEILYFDD